jgi:hypothetical protein
VRILLTGLTGLLFVNAFAHAASPAFAPHPNLLREPGILSPTTALGSSGVALRTQLADARSGGSLFGIAGSFPFDREADFRASGWAWGFGAGLTGEAPPPASQNPPALYGPSTTYWELMVGRGTIDPFGRGDSGIRGYLEFVVRNQRPQRNRDLAIFERSYGVNFENNGTSIGLRGGVSNHDDGKGFVKQPAPNFTYDLTVGLNLPMPADKSRRVMNLTGHALLPCGSEALRCGAGGYFAYLPGAKGYINDVVINNQGDTETRTVIETSHRLAAGPSVRWLFNERYAFNFSLEWGFTMRKGYEHKDIVVNGSTKTTNSPIRRFGSSGVPTLATEFMVAF